MSQTLPDPASMALLSFAEIGLSPRGACLVGADALAAGRVDIAERLVFALREKMLPDPASNPWDGPAGSFWQRALRLDRVQWLEASIGRLPKEQAKDCARSLLMQSARCRAFESFEYLLSLGAARRSWKLLEAAYQAGGAGAAKKVKKPTELEAVNLLRPSGSNGGRSIEDLLWCAQFLGPDHRCEPAWIERLAFQVGDDLAAACLPRAAAFKLDVSGAHGEACCARLAAQGSARSALDLADSLGVSPTAAFSELTVSMPLQPGHATPVKLQGVSLMECAVIGRCADLAEKLLKAGAKMPTDARLRHLVIEQAPHWYRDQFKALFERVNAFRETLELQGAVSASSVKPARPRGL